MSTLDRYIRVSCIVRCRPSFFLALFPKILAMNHVDIPGKFVVLTRRETPVVFKRMNVIGPSSRVMTL